MKPAMKLNNALVHGVYSSDIILPWEKAEEFHQLLAGLRGDFCPQGTIENDIVFDIACLHWKKRRVNRIMQLALVQNEFAAKIEETGKRSVEGMRTAIDVQRLKQERKRTKITAGISDLSDAMVSLAAEVSNKKRPSLGKLGANIRSILGVLENLEPTIIATQSKAEIDGKAFDLGPCVDILSKALELEARLVGLIAKAIQRLVMAREFRRQYPPKPTLKLIGPSTAKTAVTGITTKKIVDDNGNEDNDNDNNNNDNNNNNLDNVDRPENFDWPHEYDEFLAARRKKT
jgi:hypothetical protein